jgi:hypothetical protein
MRQTGGSRPRLTRLKKIINSRDEVQTGVFTGQALDKPKASKDHTCAKDIIISSSS